VSARILDSPRRQILVAAHRPMRWSRRHRHPQLDTRTMSYDLSVYTRRDKLPTSQQLASALAAASPSVIVGDDFPDLGGRFGGFASLVVNGHASGFEIASSAISPTRAELFRQDVEESGEEFGPANLQYFEILTTCDLHFVFSCRDEREVQAAAVVAEVLASLSSGYVTDPQKGTTRGPAERERETSR
jgi:hypothetical protein